MSFSITTQPKSKLKLSRMTVSVLVSGQSQDEPHTDGETNQGCSPSAPMQQPVQQPVQQPKPDDGKAR